MQINLLVTLDSKYIRPLKVMLASMFINNPEENFHVYLVHSSIKDEEIADLGQFMDGRGAKTVSDQNR